MLDAASRRTEEEVEDDRKVERRCCQASCCLTVTLSKDACSGPSVCQRARAPCVLDRPGIRAGAAQLLLQGVPTDSTAAKLRECGLGLDIQTLDRMEYAMVTAVAPPDVRKRPWLVVRRMCYSRNKIAYMDHVYKHSD